DDGLGHQAVRPTVDMPTGERQIGAMLDRANGVVERLLVDAELTGLACHVDTEPLRDRVRVYPDQDFDLCGCARTDLLQLRDFFGAFAHDLSNAPLDGVLELERALRGPRK